MTSIIVTEPWFKLLQLYAPYYHSWRGIGYAKTLETDYNEESKTIDLAQCQGQTEEELEAQ